MEVIADLLLQRWGKNKRRRLILAINRLPQMVLNAVYEKYRVREPKDFFQYMRTLTALKKKEFTARGFQTKISNDKLVFPPTINEYLTALFKNPDPGIKPRPVPDHELDPCFEPISRREIE